MCKKDYLLSNTIIFDSKPIAVPYNYRVSYKISQLALILSLCCSRGGCSLVKLHMISVALNSEVSMLQMERIADGILSELPVIRFDPAVNRALLFCHFGRNYCSTKKRKVKAFFTREKICRNNNEGA